MRESERERERERERDFSAMRADIFINISYKGAKFFFVDFWLDSLKDQISEYYNFLKYFFYLYRSFFFH
jgi:hypothetical protein